MIVVALGMTSATWVVDPAVVESGTVHPVLLTQALLLYLACRAAAAVPGTQALSKKTKQQIHGLSRGAYDARAAACSGSLHIFVCFGTFVATWERS